jgi:DNA-binding PadR family transcriptional regulator
MDRSLGRVWPRAQSKLYEEPKKLAGLGLARSRVETTGRRRRTVYSITPKGRRALADWLSEPGAGPVLEFEGLLKVVFAENGDRADVLATLAAVRDWAEERNRDNLQAARAYATGAGPFQERAAQNLLGGRFLTEFYRTVHNWATWATSVADQWPDDPRRATANPSDYAETVARANWSQTTE